MATMSITVTFVTRMPKLEMVASMLVNMQTSTATLIAAHNATTPRSTAKNPKKLKQKVFGLCLKTPC